MDTTMTLEELRRRNVEIDAHEAVAIAQKLICEPGSNEDAHAPYGPLSLDTIAIDGDGTVHCRRTAATPSALEVGIVLDRAARGGHVRRARRAAIHRESRIARG